MTILKIYKLNDDEKPQAIISFSEKGGELKPININPCFYKAANKKHIEIVPINGRKKLHDGDSFALLADSFWFKVQLTSDDPGLNKTTIKKKETLSGATSKQSKFQVKSDDSSVSGDVINESKQSQLQDKDDADMKINALFKEIPSVPKHKINPSGKKFKSFQEAIAAEKRKPCDLTSQNCKKIKVEPAAPADKLLADKQVVDTKKLLENIRQIVIEDYPEAVSLLGDDSPKNTGPKERKYKTIKVGKNININPSVESLDSSSKKTYKPLLKTAHKCTEPSTEGKATDTSVATKNQKVPSVDPKSHKECSSEDTLLKESFGPKNNCIQQEAENIRKHANIAFENFTDHSNMYKGDD
ncbi:unnamed protein product [Callosobruchus maculatus]|uniref:Uncharacterized protein n=1 Tax=Callosobruchus maculatus TaxID=64391 RepID=A0A653CW67_CALMS|nr:unnamed protein product [Callosobruchus maculatus]